MEGRSQVTTPITSSIQTLPTEGTVSKYATDCPKLIRKTDAQFLRKTFVRSLHMTPLTYKANIITGFSKRQRRNHKLAIPYLKTSKETGFRRFHIFQPINLVIHLRFCVASPRNQPTLGIRKISVSSKHFLPENPPRNGDHVQISHLFSTS